MLRSVPLFPRYFFLPIGEARARQLHYVRGLCGHQYLLATAEGRIWEAPGSVIFELARAENEGRFDEVPPELGDRVRLKRGGALSAMDLDCLQSRREDRTAVLAPLRWGARDGEDGRSDTRGLTMTCRSIADILRRMGETPPPDKSLFSTQNKEPQPTEIATDPPVPPGTPWIDSSKIEASRARDILERTNDDRSLALRREQGAKALAVARLSRRPKFNFGAKAKPKSAPKPKAKRERTD